MRGHGGPAPLADVDERRGGGGAAPGTDGLAAAMSPSAGAAVTGLSVTSGVTDAWSLDFGVSSAPLFFVEDLPFSRSWKRNSLSSWNFRICSCICRS